MRGDMAASRWCLVHEANVTKSYLGWERLHRKWRRRPRLKPRHHVKVTPTAGLNSGHVTHYIVSHWYFDIYPYFTLHFKFSSWFYWFLFIEVEGLEALNSGHVTHYHSQSLVLWQPAIFHFTLQILFLILLVSFIEVEGLEALNSGEVTHFHSQSLVLWHLSIFHFTLQILFLILVGGSYRIVLETTASTPQSRSPRWRLDKADWPLFTELISSFRPLVDFDTCDEPSTLFTDALHSAAFQSIHRTSGQLPKRPVPRWKWWCH